MVQRVGMAAGGGEGEGRVWDIRRGRSVGVPTLGLKEQSILALTATQCHPVPA